MVCLQLPRQRISRRFLFLRKSIIVLAPVTVTSLIIQELIIHNKAAAPLVRVLLLLCMVKRLVGLFKPPEIIIMSDGNEYIFSVETVLGRRRDINIFAAADA